MVVVLADSGDGAYGDDGFGDDDEDGDADGDDAYGDDYGYDDDGDADAYGDDVGDDVGDDDDDDDDDDDVATPRSFANSVFDPDETAAERRERRREEIDAEFGDDGENWFHKWNEGLL